MAFTHGKNTQFFLRDVNNVWRDLSSYTSETALPEKAQAAETTTFGKGAKTYIPGLIEGTMTIKGFYDTTATTGPDPILAGLLGFMATKGLYGPYTQQGGQPSGAVSGLGQFQFCPQGAPIGSTNQKIVGDCVLTDYSISAPVGNVVSWSSAFTISGLVVRDVTASNNASNNLGATS